MIEKEQSNPTLGCIASSNFTAWIEVPVFCGNDNSISLKQFGMLFFSQFYLGILQATIIKNDEIPHAPVFTE